MAYTYKTSCCALSQLTASNYDSIKDIRNAITREKRQNNVRAIFCITQVNESILENHLIQLKFQHISTFKRKKCYPQTDLKMWIKTYK